MKRNLIFSFLLTIIFALGCQSTEPTIVAPAASPSEIRPSAAAQPTPASMPQAPTPAPSCAKPTSEMAAACQDQVAQILNATVRIELEYWSEGQIVAETGSTRYEVAEATSHATLINKRYLITHNHFPISPRELKEDTGGLRLRLSLYTLQGEAILKGASLRNFDVVAEWPETLVLDFRESGEVLFKAFGVRSMPVGTTAVTHLPVGTEVAQINWDGAKTWVEWVRIERMTTEQGVTQIILSSSVRKGASGGGVFWNGQHIGNNWTTNKVRNSANGEVIDTYSVAAVNAEMLFSS